MNLLLFPSLAACFCLLLSVNAESIPSCSSPVYCQGDLLDTVQRAKPFNDSKTFVDMKMKNSVQTTLDNFAEFKKTTPNPSKDAIRQFVEDNFEEADEFEPWIPEDFTENPKLIDRITAFYIDQFAKDVVKIWKTLAKKVKQEVFDNSERYSLIPVPNGFIVPGGRFREFYYWDTYWIIRGLIQSDMTKTARGMLENFVYIIKNYGIIPNGARVYYLNRSQLPLLTSMVEQYLAATQDFGFVEENIEYLDQELSFWLENRMVAVTKDGKTYKMAHYDSESPSPRPESYLEDINTAAFYDTEEEREAVYCEMKTTAESGEDFSSRWIIDENGGTDASLPQTKTRSIIPVELNAVLSRSFKLLSDFYLQLNNTEKHVYWLEESTTLQKTIEEVHYDKTDGIWYDYNLIHNKPRKFFYPTNFAPLWARAVDPLKLDAYGAKALEYLKRNNLLNFRGGIPSSLVDNGQQWDLPNAWAPLQSFVVEGLYRSGNEEAKLVARDLGWNWVEATLIGYSQTQQLFEKYDALVPGQYGGGGEYEVQSGFGWTNGVVLDFIDLFFTD